MHRVTSVTCTVNKEYKYNDKFEILGGETFFSKENGLCFPEGYVKPDGIYKTMFGPFFWHPGVIYSRDDKTMSKALLRQINIREPTLPGLDEKLTRNQKSFVFRNSTINYVVNKIAGAFNHKMLDFPDFEDALYSFVTKPHVKRAERMAAYEEWRAAAHLYHRTYCRSVEGKVKTEEWGKFEKLARLFLSLGPLAVLLSGFLMDVLKSSFNVFESEDYEAEFYKEDSARGVLGQIFAKLIHPPRKLYFAFFSDDSCVSIRCLDGRVFRANVDIASCDGSHTVVLFDLLKRLTCRSPRSYNRIARTVDQCLQPMKIKSYTTKRGHVVFLKPYEPVLYTGSTLTTVVNNIANLMIFSSLVDTLKGEMPDYSDCRALIRSCAEDCGYLVTIEECHTPHKLQFLKHSPVETTSGWIPILNLGVILRILGNCWGDLPGRKTESFEDRAYNWNRALTLSLVHSGDHALLRMLRKRYNATRGLKQTQLDAQRRVSRDLAYKLQDVGSHTFVDTDEVMKRYGLPGSALDELIQLYSETTDGAGDSIYCLASKAILQADYGYAM